MDIKSLHHVAYRCKDARQTAEFYTKVLGLEYAMALSEDRVPSTGEPHPYMHIFFRMDDGSYVAFFELPESPEMGRDANTPSWVQHLALRVADEATLLKEKTRLESHGVHVLGPVNLPAGLPGHASQMLSRNLSALLLHLVKDGALNLDWTDDITAGACVVRPRAQGAPA